MFEGGGGNLTPAMTRVLVFSIVTFTLLYAVLLSFRYRLERLSARVEEMRYR